jgi:hypothetical protein
MKIYKQKSTCICSQYLFESLCGMYILAFVHIHIIWIQSHALALSTSKTLGELMNLYAIQYRLQIFYLFNTDDNNFLLHWLELSLAS